HFASTAQRRADSLGGNLRLIAQNDFSGHEPLRQADVANRRLQAVFGMELLRPLCCIELRYDACGIIQVAEHDRLGRAYLDAARLFPPVVKQVRAKRALLRNVSCFIPKDHSIWTCGDDLTLADRLFGIEEHDAIIASANGSAAGSNTGRLGAVQARNGNMRQPYPWERTALVFPHIDPLLACLRLRDCDRQVVIAGVFVAACQKATVAADASANIDHHSVARHLHRPQSMFLHSGHELAEENATRSKMCNAIMIRAD